jgi:hypothetical protein
MDAIEFQASIKNGTIEIPSRYRKLLSGRVRVILLTEDHEAGTNMIEQLLANPVRIDSFEPLSRSQAHER